VYAGVAGEIFALVAQVALGVPHLHDTTSIVGVLVKRVGYQLIEEAKRAAATV
jgi:hypothetical protein